MLRPILCALVSILAVSESIWAWPQLPDRVAAHFDGSGSPDGWSMKAGFFGLMAGVWLLMLLVFFGLARWVPRIPNSLINLPHKDHWLAPERREASLTWLRDWMQEVGILTLILMAGVLHLTLRANLEEGGTLAGFGWWMGVYFGALSFWLVRLFVRFRRSAT